MGRAKEIKVKVIPSKIANAFVKKHHYSGKVVPNSTLHFGCFLDGKIGGVMSFGPSINKKGTMNAVRDTGWNEFIELNRMAFSDMLPKYSESRCIAISIKLIKKQAPQIKWIISFADGCQCGDGTIYRASGFNLIKIKKNTSMWKNKITGKKMQDMQFYHTMTKKDNNWERLDGVMFTYIYFIDKKFRDKLTVPILPFSEIDKQGAGMYKGEKITLAKRRGLNQSGEVDLNSNS
jgi:hypothetical protein